MKKTRSKNSRPSVRSADLQARALELRKGGMNYREIAAQMGVSSTLAFGLVAKAMDQLRAHNLAEASTLRDLETARLDRLIVALWPRAIGAGGEPDIAASRQVLALLESRRRLWGIDAPDKMEVRGGGLTPEAVQTIRQSILGIEPTE